MLYWACWQNQIWFHWFSVANIIKHYLVQNTFLIYQHWLFCCLYSHRTSFSLHVRYISFMNHYIYDASCNVQTYGKVTYQNVQRRANCTSSDFRTLPCVKLLIVYLKIIKCTMHTIMIRCTRLRITIQKPLRC